MAEEDSLAALQGLHRDLCAHIDLNLPVLDRLVESLQAHIEDLKALLEKKPKNDASRKALNAGKITIGDDEYEVNDDFKNQALELAEALELDEMDAAALFMGAQREAEELDRTQLQTAVIRFHRRREFVLLCVRILMKTALDNGEVEVHGVEILQEAVRLIVGVESTNLANAYGFWTKCLTSMEAVETWLHNIAERVQSIQVVGQVPPANFVEIMTFQQQSLTRQHENLAAICTHMVKAGYINVDNYKQLLTRARKLDKHDLITIHYVPVLLSVTSWVAAETNTTLDKAREVHKMLMDGRDSDNWVSRNLHAATLTWWLSEYSGRYVDPNMQDPAMQRIDLDKEATERSDTFLKALDDGAFHFMLSCSQDIRPSRWYDPQKTSMLSTLLQDAAVLSSDTVQPEEFFKVLVMQQLQAFVDSFITHMPDTLRRLKAEEDDSRRRLGFGFQISAGVEYPLHLERFMVIVAYAFDGFPDAAEDFWSDKESNLYGFLQWAAKRQPTPRIAMFCEMLRAISAGESNADAAHRFLLEEGVGASGKIRRTSSLSYTHIFNELIEFERDIHEPRKPIQGNAYAPTTNPVDQIVEPESATMLESYLRLLAHVCRQSHVARFWILELKDYDFAHICFGLCTDKVESGLRAAAYDALAALLVGKTPPRADGMWHTLDDWSVTGFYPSSKQNNTISQLPRDDFWNTLADGYDESIAFVRLLHCLVEPYPENEGLNDSLPFPESLGSARRMPGIESFVDFVMQLVFAERSQSDVLDSLQRNVLRWTCLRFMVTCLSTFNENLVVFANKSSIPVDAVIDTSSLANYVMLHPFARVMEWLFNDKVLKALFAASHHDVAEVDAAPSDSPLVQSLMLSIEVMDLVMKLQATYSDIVRPVLKQQPSYQLSSVANLSLASFEDAVLNNLEVIVDLGLYCGTGHEALTISSLQLLEKMASSRKLAISPAGFGQRSGRSKIVGILEKDKEAERIGRSLSSMMRFSPEELEAGEEASGYIVKLRILDFLNSCLAAVSNRPTIAHILLGFSCGSNTVHIADDSLWREGQSLFHTILLLSVEYPDSDGEQFVAWRSTLKTRCWDVLQKLWRSPLTSAIVMEELRDNELLFVEAPRLMTITLDTPWEGLSHAEGVEFHTGEGYAFFANCPAVALQNFLQQRAAFLDYESRELRLTVKESMPSMRSRIQQLLLGVTVRPGVDAVPNVNIFDLFDFIEFSYPDLKVPDKHPLIDGVSLSSCQEEKDSLLLYSLPLLEQVIMLRLKAWRKEGVIVNEDQEMYHMQQAQALLTAFLGLNRCAQLMRYHKDILQTWVQVVMVAVHSCEFEDAERSTFILQTLQAILPKLEQAYNGDVFTSLQLATLSESLIQKVDFKSTALDKTGDFANDRLSQLFRAALTGIYSAVSTVELREYCYQICFRYIHGTFAKATTNSQLGRHTLLTIKNCGTHLIEVVCDDAYSGTGTCKVSALFLLNALVAVATVQQSKYILETFVTINFVSVLVDNIKHIPSELRGATAAQVPTLLSYYDASFALLLRIAQSRLGAAYVLNAGIFAAIRNSHIFAVDPDIGLEFDDPNALKKYYELMLSVLRVVNAAVIARGRQNDQTVFQAREFLKENRHSMVSVFKRSVSPAGSREEVASELADLVDCWTVLVDVSGFLKYEDETSVKKARPNMFS